MTFAAPFFLIGLFPWGIIAAWLLWGRRLKQSVPFLPLWEGALPRQNARRSMQTPPFALAAALLAMLLAVLGAAQPIVRSGSSNHVTLMIDRSVTMSAIVGGRARFAALAESVGEQLRAQNPIGTVEVVDVLTGQRRESNPTSWVNVVNSLPRTALGSLPLLAAVEGELARGSDPVILLSDAPAEINDPRFTQIFPSSAVHIVGITTLSARELPSAQVMVGVRSDGISGPVELRVSSNGRTVSQTITFPQEHGEQRVFLDLPALGETIEVRLVVVDDLDADNMAWLVRKGRPARIEIRSPVPEALRRMAQVYAQVLPARADSPVVILANSVADLPYGDAGVVNEIPAASAAASGALRVTTYPITALVDWPEVTRGATVAAMAPAGWTPLVTIGDRVLVARRETPARQVWVGFDSPQWPRSADFVVFWTNVWNWASGGAGNDFASHPVSVVPESWKRQTPAPSGVQVNAWPGIFRRADGSQLAMNAIDIHFPPPRDAKLPARFKSEGRGLANLSPWLMLMAIVCLLASALTWRRKGSTWRLPGTSFASNATA
jgi:hypothetical protein